MKTNLFDLDLGRLEAEWNKQPSLFYQASKRLTRLQKQLRIRKARLDVIESELDLAIRRRPEKFGLGDLGKLTEKPIANAIKLHKRYQRALSIVHKWQHRVDLAQDMIRALEHRKKALEKEVDLWLAGYFAKPKASRGSRERMQKAERRHTFKFNREED